MDRENLPESLVAKLDALPALPGVYLFKDAKGTVVYVGKAKSLRARVRSYFQDASSDTRGFIPLLLKTLGDAGDVETIVTSGEKEALILENNLIKQHWPRFNVKLRDDKDYLSIRLDAKTEWPKLDVVRRPSPDGARYFGPYHSATAARRTLHLVNKHFQLRTCSDTEMKTRRRPCLQFQIKRCPAPCVYEVDKPWYDEQVDAVGKFLDGRHDELSRELDARMKRAAREMRFELAAVYRDQLRAIEKVREDQRVVTVDDVDRDVLGMYREGDLCELAILYVRAGKLADVSTLSVKGTEIPDEEIVGAFLTQHYSRPSEDKATYIPVPDEVILPVLPEGAQGVTEWLAERGGHKVTLIVPQRGARVDLLAMANDNAKHAFQEKRRAVDDVNERLEQMQERLRLPTLPRRIECCDISHLGGGDTVGAIVAVKDGVPDKKHYRTFHVRGARGTGADGESARSAGRSTPGAGDDYAAMYEVLARRFRRGRTAKKTKDAAGAIGEEASSPAEPVPQLGAGEPVTQMPEAEAREQAEQIDWELPDLFVVDGGKGQLNVALAAAHDLGLHGMPIVALAKEKENQMGETLVDRVYLPGQKNPINLRSHSASLFFLARARDEAHRFSNRARERLGKARRMRSALDDVAGIGPVTKKALLSTLGSLAAVKRASDEELLAVPGVSARHVKALRRAFSRAPEAGEEPASVEPKSVPPTS
jgi:excinuclease ABC subunit C